MPFWVEEPSPSCLLPTAAPHRDGQRAPSQTSSVKATSQPLGAPEAPTQTALLARIPTSGHHYPNLYLGRMVPFSPVLPQFTWVVVWPASRVSSGSWVSVYVAMGSRVPQLLWGPPPIPQGSLPHSLSHLLCWSRCCRDGRGPAPSRDHRIQGLPGPCWPPLCLVRQLCPPHTLPLHSGACRLPPQKERSFAYRACALLIPTSRRIPGDGIYFDSTEPLRLCHHGPPPPP